MLKAEIYVTCKKSVSDPQGLVVRHALESLGFRNLKEVRIGKFITIEIDTKNKKKAKRTVDNMCRKLLANPIIEDYSFRIKENKNR